MVTYLPASVYLTMAIFSNILARKLIAEVLKRLIACWRRVALLVQAIYLPSSTFLSLKCPMVICPYIVYIYNHGEFFSNISEHENWSLKCSSDSIHVREHILCYFRPFICQKVLYICAKMYRCRIVAMRRCITNARFLRLHKYYFCKSIFRRKWPSGQDMLANRCSVISSIFYVLNYNIFFPKMYHSYIYSTPASVYNHAGNFSPIF